MQHVFEGERLMKKLAVLSIFTSTLLCAGDSGRISGVVLDPSQRPIDSAEVDCAGRRVATDVTGRFVIEGVDRCDASVSKSGFQTAQQPLTAGALAQVTLAIASLSETVVVTATRTPTTIEESGISASVITKDQLEERQFPPIAEILRETPSVSIAATGRRAGVTSIFLRGGASTDTLFLLDGVPLNEPGGQIDLAPITTAGLDRIEVVRGPESALFGADAASGVVQLFTARGDVEDTVPHGSVSYERGNFQTDRWTANVNGGASNRLDYSLTAAQFHTVGMFPNDFYRDTTGTANIGYRLSPSTTLRAVYREFDADGGDPNEVGFGIVDYFANDSTRDSSFMARVDDTRGRHFVQSASFDYHRERYDYYDDSDEPPQDVAALVRDVAAPTPRVYLVQLVSPDFPASAVPPGLTLATNTIYFGGGDYLDIEDRTDFNYQGTWTEPAGALVFGYEFEREAGMISNANVTRNNNGAFVHEQYRFGRLYLTGGARIEHSSTFGDRFAPRGSAAYELFGEHGIFSSTLLRMSGGRGILEPSLLENFAEEPYYVGNAALKPENTNTVDAGIVQEWFHRRLRTEAALFDNSFTDLIVFDASVYPGTWSNIESSWARGVEFSATAHLLRFVEIGSSYTHMRTKITATNDTDPYSGVGQDLPRRPDNAGSGWIALHPRRWTLVLGGQLTGEQQDSDYVFGITRNPGYGTMYLSGSFALTRHVAPYFRVDNLLNEHYEEVLGYTSLARNGVGGVRLSW
jgi:vitamin B12 transporter